MRINYLKELANYWDKQSANYSESHPEFRESGMHPSWGLVHIHEATIGLLGRDLVVGRTLLELGCGIGHDAVGFAKLGLNVIAVDLSSAQLGRAIRDPRVQYINTAAEHLPLPSNSIDIVVSDHGAFDHSPTELLLRETHRVLHPGGIAIVCTYSPLAIICYDPQIGRIGRSLNSDYPSERIQYDGASITSERSYSEWIRAFHAGGFAVERLEELRPWPGSPAYFTDLVAADWAERWPVDIAWVVRKSGTASSTRDN